MRIRMATPADTAAMAELERANSVKWSQKHHERLDRATIPERIGYFVIVAEETSESNSCAASGPSYPVVGYLAAYRVEDEWELQYIVVAQECHHRGIATYLVDELIRRVRAAKGSSIFLEVRESNQNARALYRKVGFEEISLRKGYYTDPPENAIVCRLEL